MIRNRRQSD